MIERKARNLISGVAQDVRVGGAAGFVFAQGNRQTPAPCIPFEKFHDFQVDAEHVGHRHHIHQILARRTVFVVTRRPQFFAEQADHVVALLFEEQGGHRRIHAAGHADDDFSLRETFGPPSSQGLPGQHHGRIAMFPGTKCIHANADRRRFTTPAPPKIRHPPSETRWRMDRPHEKRRPPLPAAQRPSIGNGRCSPSSHSHQNPDNCPADPDR